MPANRQGGAARVLGCALLLAVLAGCGDPPQLEVGPIGYDEEELGVLGPSQRRTLMELTAFGIAISQDRIDEVIEPQVRSDIRSLIRQLMAMQMTLDEAGIDEDRLREAYERDPQQELEVRHLVVISEEWRPPAHRDSARARAGEALQRIRAGEDFLDVVAEYSDEARAAERGGLLAPGREGTWAEEFWDAAASLDVGEVSGVVETDFGYHVLRLEDRRAVPFEDARQDVVEQFVNLEQSMARTSEWVSERQAPMRVDTGTILMWRTGEIPDDTLITWPDSMDIPPYTGADLAAYIESFRPETVAAIRQSDSANTVGFVETAARTHIILDRAAELGIEPTEAQRAAIRRRWRDQMDVWIAALGYAEGMPLAEVKAQAFRNLGSPQQSVARARNQIRTVSGRLLEMYPVTYRPGEGSDEAEG